MWFFFTLPSIRILSTTQTRTGKNTSNNGQITECKERMQSSVLNSGEGLNKEIVKPSLQHLRAKELQEFLQEDSKNRGNFC
jgi:hypothetical protein